MGNGKLEGKSAIVTGAASGIGRATALAMAREGALLLLADLDLSGAKRVVSEIESTGGRGVAHEVDVSEEAGVEAMIAAAVKAFGGLDLLHNNAADSSPRTQGGDGDIHELEVEIWDRALAVNLRGPMLGCKHAIPHMLARGGGAIVNTSSLSGLVGDVARCAYGASKAGVDSLTRYVATQYGKRGIRCNAVAPGAIATPALEANISPEQMAIYERSHLAPRLGRPEDIASAVVFLCSEDAAFITGQVVCVDGGTLAHHPTFAEFGLAGVKL